jgi:hypothetical protein
MVTGLRYFVNLGMVTGLRYFVNLGMVTGLRHSVNLEKQTLKVFWQEPIEYL